MVNSEWSIAIGLIGHSPCCELYAMNYSVIHYSPLTIHSSGAG